MKLWLFLAATLLGAGPTAWAQSRVSIEIGGAVSGYDLGSTPAGSVRSALSTASTSTTMTDVGNVVEPRGPTSGIGVFEVRPTVILDRGFLFGVGFRDGAAGLGRGATNLVGGDVSLGYAHQYGRFMPFAKAMFGFNVYDAVDGSAYLPKHTDLRLDAVLGTRLYLSRRMFVSASAFAGLGDQYGGALAVGGDVIQFVHHGVMP